MIDILREGGKRFPKRKSKVLSRSKTCDTSTLVWFLDHEQIRLSTSRLEHELFVHRPVHTAAHRGKCLNTFLLVQPDLFQNIEHPDCLDCPFKQTFFRLEYLRPRRPDLADSRHCTPCHKPQAHGNIEDITTPRPVRRPTPLHRARQHHSPRFSPNTVAPSSAIGR